MPPPPPPGPPAPPPPGPGARSQPAFKPKSGGNDRSALLKSIQNGAQLKKTVTNDRSAPIVGSVKNNTSSSENPSRGGSGTGSSQSYGSNGSGSGPLPGIGGLFAGGMPTLKKTSGGVSTGRLLKPGQGDQNRVTNNFGNSRPSNSISSSNLSKVNNWSKPSEALSSVPSYEFQSTLSRVRSIEEVCKRTMPSPKPLVKSKSSTFISPDQQKQTPVFNNKVVLSLRSSSSHLKPPIIPKETVRDKPSVEGKQRNNFYFGSKPEQEYHIPNNGNPALSTIAPKHQNNTSPNVSLNKPPPPPSNDKPRVPSPSPSSNSPRTKTIGPVHPATKPPPPPEPGHRAGNPPSRSSKSFSQARPSATIGPGPQSRTPLPMQQPVSRDDISIQNGKLSNPPPPPVRTVSRGAPPPPPSGKRPSQPPPPPPSTGRPPLRDLPPPPPPNHGQSMNGPPTPPTRRESIRKNETPPSSESFESKFSGKFRSMQYLPPPELFSRCQKTYPSKTSAPVRQGSQVKRTQAPPPPPCKPPLPPGPPPARSWPATSVS